jgi:hypothetical protein
MERFQMFVTNSSSSSSRETKCIPTEEETSASSSSSSSFAAAAASTQIAALGYSLHLRCGNYLCQQSLVPESVEL